MTNPYAAPLTDVDQIPEPETSSAGSLENGIAGNYSLTIGGIIGEAWSLVSGAKLTLVLYGFIYIVVATAGSFLLEALGINGSAQIDAGNYISGMLLSVSSGLLLLPITVPLIAGGLYLGMRRALGHEIDISEGFVGFKQIASFTVVGLLTAFMTYLGLALLILPGIYLSIAYILAIPLIVDRKLSPWQAMETSRKAITKKWFTVFGILISLMLIFMISAIPLGIGVIWSGPLMVIAIGVIYKKVFGVVNAE